MTCTGLGLDSILLSSMLYVQDGEMMMLLAGKNKPQYRSSIALRYRTMAIFVFLFFALIVGLEGACLACGLDESEHQDSSINCACLCHIPPSVIHGSTLPLFTPVPAVLLSHADGAFTDTYPSEIFHPPKDLS